MTETTNGPSRRAWLTGIFGTLSVVVSPGLVAWELRQNTVAVRAPTYDRLAEG